jgi:hypothetical protein
MGGAAGTTAAEEENDPRPGSAAEPSGSAHVAAAAGTGELAG